MAALSPLWLATVVLFSVALVQPIAIWAARQEVQVGKGAVAADDGRCSEVGRDILMQDGNAVDAAVATALCLGVVGAASSGIGGGAFMIIRLANGTTTVLDMRERAPAAAYEDMYLDKPEAKFSGPLSVAVPGEVKGLYHAWKHYGSQKIKWYRLVLPAIKLARDGFTVSKYLYHQMLVDTPSIFRDPGLRSVYTDGNNLLQPGAVCRNKQLANSLSAIALEGPSALYNGSIGVNLVKDIQQRGGIITMKDLEEYSITIREPLHAKNVFGKELGLEVLTMPPPSSGGVSVLLMLNIIEKYGIAGIAGELGKHRFIEALKHVYATRMNLGDWDFKKHVYEVVRDMLSIEFAEAIKANISDDRTFNNPALYGATWAPLPDDGTSHMSIIDTDRNAVALTCTVNNHFGSQFLSPTTGILLNNQMDDFSTPKDGSHKPPAPGNWIEPGKRPLSSMSPTIVLKDGKLQAVMGASGGPLIIIAVTQVFLNHFGFKLDPLSSVNYPRCYHKLFPNIVYYENYTTVTNDLIQVPDNMLNYLSRKGHVLETWDGEGAICQFVVHNLESKGTLTAVSDPRKGGYPAGY